MQLFLEPQAWLSFFTLTVLEIVLGIDNIIFLILLVDRLPPARRRSARFLGLAFAMLTRIGLLFSVTWLATLTKTLFVAFGSEISGRDLILFGGGLFLLVNSVVEIGDTVRGGAKERRPGGWNGFWLIIVQIGVIDIIFSLDSVFTAVGLSKHIEVMVTAIVVSALIMMWVASAVSTFIERYPTIKILALAFLVLVGVSLMAQAFDVEIPAPYLYVSMAFAAAVEWINIHVRQPGRPNK
jgi:predicted tellurium resistance membrane protein TerC